MYRDSQHGLTIDLAGPDGNAFALMGYVSQYAKQMEKNADEIIADMTTGDYNHLLTVFEREFPIFTLINKPGDRNAE
jgi:hypothetical protein